jgi:hypothetical protein
MTDPVKESPLPLSSTSPTSEAIDDTIRDLQIQNKYARALTTYGSEIKRLNILAELLLELSVLGTPAPHVDTYDNFTLVWSSSPSKDIAWLRLTPVGDWEQHNQRYLLTGFVFATPDQGRGKLAAIELSITNDVSILTAKANLIPFANALRRAFKSSKSTTPQTDDRTLPPGSAFQK